MLNPENEKKLKYAAKGLKGIKAIANALGTSPTATPDVDTKISKTYDNDGSTTGNKPSDRDYKIDENGVGGFDDEPKPRRMRDPRKRTAY